MSDSNDITNKSENDADLKKSGKETSQKDKEGYPSQNKITVLGSHPKNRSCQKIKNACKKFLKIIKIILNAFCKLFIGHAISYYINYDNTHSKEFYLNENIEKYVFLNSTDQAKFENLIQDINYIFLRIALKFSNII